MHSYKMLLPKLILFTLWMEYGSTNDDDVVFVSGNKYCITNGSSAIIFNDEIGEETKQYDFAGSSFYPVTSDQNSFACDFDYNCPNLLHWTGSTGWSEIGSLDGPVDPYITDRRWEALPIHRSQHIEGQYKDLKYHSMNFVIKNDGSNFLIPFSVRGEQDGHVFLCEGERDPSESNCYWLMLGAFGGNTSAIRRCTKNMIPQQDKKYPQSTCKELRSQEKYNGSLDEKNWNHFKIVKKESTLEVMKNNEHFLVFHDNSSDFFNPSSMWIHSKNVNLLWKIHNFKYLFTHTEGVDQVGHKILIEHKTLCISMFIALCDSCSLIWKVKGSDNSFVQNRTFGTTKGEWKQVKLTYDTSNLVNESLSVYAIRVKNSVANNGSYFWAIDDVRLCNETEYRFIKSDETDTPCQMIGSQNDGKLLITNGNNEIETKGINCPENSIGERCVPCQIFGNSSCTNFKYCEMVNGQEKCYCSPGYQEEHCSSKCQTGKYGHGCQKDCPTFCLECNHDNGFCGGKCQYTSFEGNYCEKPPEPFFSSPPIIYDVTFSSFKVRMNSLEMVGAEDGDLYYIFQYMKDTNQYEGDKVQNSTENVEDLWMNNSRMLAINDTEPVMIGNLDVDSFYKVRAVIRNRKKSGRSLQQKKDYVKSTRQKTFCNELQDSDVDIIPANVSATVTIKKGDHTCRLESYYYSMIGSNFTFVSEKFEISQLVPNQQYSLTIRKYKNGKEIKVLFKTTEGVPSDVRNILFKESNDSLDISWSEPLHKNGNTRYKIEWKFLHKIPCAGGKNQSVFLESQVSKPSITLRSLRPYSTYQIGIQAFTSIASGPLSTRCINTSSNAYLSEREMISIESLNQSSHDVEFQLGRINCDDQDGPIYMNVRISCNNKWCRGIEENFTFPFDHYVTVFDLLPFSNYTVYMDVSRDGEHWKESDSKMFQTDTSVPNVISELEAYSKDANSISLRWIPPYPPTGILEGYKIQWRTWKWQIWETQESTVYPTNCSIWPEFHCADVTGLWQGYTYNIRVQARNKVPFFGYGKISQVIYVKTEEEAPQAPYNLNFSWQGDDLNISWYHPNVTNGHLKSFEIWLHLDGNNQNRIVKYLRFNSRSDYKLIYNYTLPIQANSMMFCSTYKVSVRCHNSYTYSDFKSGSTITPPESPPKISKENIHYDNTNTTITINMEYQDTGRGYHNKTLYIVVSESGTEEDLLELTDSLQNGKEPILKTSRIVLGTERTDGVKTFTIGDRSGNVSRYSNPPLKPGTNYSITLYFINECFGKARLWRIQKYMITKGDPEMYDPDNGSRSAENNEVGVGLWALILLLFIPLVALGYWYMKQKRKRVQASSGASANSRIEEVPLTVQATEIPTRINVVKPKKTLPTQVLTPVRTKYSKRIKLVDFVDYVKTAVEQGELEEQHDLFPRGLLEKHERGSLMQNKSKNRYKNLIAYDHSRVKLREISGDEYSDYINANYIDGYKKPRVYIATQGPKSSTLADFWRMVWQENVVNIVMLASIFENGKKKVEKYWPDINEATNYGGVKVKFVSEKVFANFDLRTFDVIYRMEKRQVKQLHFTTWPDHGVPLYPQSLVPFLRRMLKIPYDPLSPILVHCSAGVGRTGTIILCDICLRMAAGENAVDFLAHVEKLRSQRANMVDNLEQYKLAHIVVLECLFGMRTAVPCSKDMEQLVEAVLQTGGVAQQMKYLEETQWQDSIMETMLERAELVTVCAEKNRFQEIVPGNYRVYLSHHPSTDPSSSYINAVFVDDFRHPGRYIVTQQPMPNTLGDFWRMVIERGCSVIVNLNKLSHRDKSVCKFWPTKDEEMNLVDFLIIRHVNTKKMDFYEITTVLVEANNTMEKLSVDIISMSNWRPDRVLPNNMEEFLAFRDQADAISRNSKNVIVTCYDGATASGLYLATSFLIERMKLEHECDVCLAVRSIRHSRRHFVETAEQYEYLFRVSLAFINGFQCYANFD